MLSQTPQPHTAAQPEGETAHELEGELRLPGGRVLSFASFGAPGDPPVVVLDGPGSRGLARAAAAAAGDLGLRLVAPDRPGFFGSTPVPGRRVADWPADHEALLDHLGVERAGILSQSGGTPYAFAAAARLPDRVAAVAAIGAVAPLTDRAAMGEVGRDVRTAVRLATRAPWLLRAGLRRMAARAGRDPDRAADRLARDLPEADRAVLADPRLRAIHVRSSNEVFARPDAVVEELALLGGPWGVDPREVRAPVAFWSGECDATHPTSHARRLAAALGGAPVHVVAGAATLGLLPRYGEALRFAAGR